MVPVRGGFRRPAHAGRHPPTSVEWDMPSPFPGMDPYLEYPLVWEGLHNLLTVDVGRALSPTLPERYVVRVEVRKVATSDSEQSQIVEIREAYLEVRDPREPRDAEAITVIELLSPTNKLAGEGRQQYLKKRAAILRTSTSLVEIDLIRAGEEMPARLSDYPDGDAPGDYRILVARGWRRPAADVYSFGVRDQIPRFPVPLREGEDEPEVDLQRIFSEVYDTFRYRQSTNYRVEPLPPLRPEDAVWADGLLREAGLR
jgi:hypothetical protein